MRWKRVKSFFRGIRQLSFLAVFALLTFLAYLYFHGLPQSWKNAVLQELARRGVHLQIDSMHLDPLRGAIVRGVKYEARDAGGTTIRIGEFALNTDWISMLKKRFALDNVEVDGSDIQIDFHHLRRSVAIRRTSGTFHFAGGGVVELKSVMGDSLGLRVELNGRLDLGKGERREAHPIAAADIEKIRFWLARFDAVKISAPIQLKLRVEGKIAEPRTLRIEAELDGRSVAYEKWRADMVRGRLAYRDGILSVPQLSLEAGGGKSSLAGSWNIETGNAEFEMDHQLDPNALFVQGVAQRPGALREIEFGVRPEFQIKGRLDAASLGKKPWFQNVEAEGRFRLRETAWRGHLLREATGNVRLANGRIALPDLVVERAFGRLDGDFEFDPATETAKFDFKSTLDVAEVMQLLYPGEKNWFRTAVYNKPPLLQLAGEWRIRDSHGLKARGNLDWQDWSSSGVPIRSTRARVEIDGRKFHFHDLRMRRDEGEVAGEFSMDFDEQNAFLDMVSGIAFSEFTRIIGPKTEETFRHYHFLTPPKIQLRGRVHFGEGAENDLLTHVECERFQAWKFKASKVTADVHSYRRSLEIARYSSDFYDGRLMGNAAFDFSTPEGEWAFHCHVNQANFDQLTHDLWDYSEVKGRMTGWCRINGILLNSRPLRGAGEVKVTDGVLWRIPLFGELSKFIPILGVQKATKAVAGFTIADEKVHIEDMKVDAGVMSLTAKGDYKFDESVDFIVQGHFLRWLFGIGFVFDPFTKMFEYHLGGKLTDRKWNPRFLPKELLFQFDDDDDKAP